MTRAIYIKGAGGKFIFTAAFAIDGDRWDEDIAETFAENLRQEGEEVLLVNNCQLNKLPDVWQGEPK